MIEQWTMAFAKRDLKTGFLVAWRIDRAPMSCGWNVMLKGGTNYGPLVDARTKQARVFRTLEAAVSALEGIGFKVESLHRG